MSISRMDGDLFVDVSDVARMIKTSPQAVYGIINRQRMPVNTRKEEGKNRHRIPVRLLAQWLDERIAGTQNRLSMLMNAKVRMMEVINNVPVR